MDSIRIRNAALLALTIALTCGCGEKEPAKPVEKGTTAIKLSMLFPKGSTYYRGADRWAELIEKESGNKIRLEVYPGGQLLAEREGNQLGLLEAGAADIAVFRPSELAHLSPSLEVLYLPFLFPNRRSADAVLESEVGRRLLDGLRKGEVIGLGYYSGPFLQLCSTRRVVVPSDLVGLKVRLPRSRSSRIDGEAVKLLGMETPDIPLDHLRFAISKGRIDGQVSVLDIYNSLDLEKWQKHVAMLNYSFEPMVVCASSAFWNRLSREHQEMLLSTFRESWRYQRELLIKGEMLAKKKIYDKGVSLVELIPEELDLFRRVVEKKYAAMAPGSDEALISEVREEADRNREPYLYRFYDNLGGAAVEAAKYLSEAYPKETLPVKAEGSVLAHIGDAYGIDERYGIFCPVPSRLEYEVVIPPNAKLEFGIGVRPRAHKQFTDGVTFKIDVGSEDGESREIYKRTLNPFVNSVDRRWVDELLDIDLSPGKTVKIVFSAESAGHEKKAGEIYYGAIWTNPVLYEEDKDTYHRNIILISIDTLRADALGCYGNRIKASPNIDRMAKEGTLFSHCISQDTWTLSSHMSLMTSLYPAHHYMTSSQIKRPIKVELRPGHLTLAEVMRDKGYNTVAFTESGFVHSAFGFNQGFNSYSNSWTKDRDTREKTMELMPLAFRDGFVGDKGLGTGQTSSRVIFSAAQKMVKDRGKRKFFYFIHTYETHIPYFENPYLRLFSPKYSGFIPGSIDEKQQDELAARVFSGRLKMTEKDIEHLWALYSSNVRYVDDFVGEFLETLKETGLEHNTLVIFTSDHGENIYSHGQLIDHCHLPYEPVVKVPLIMRCDSIVPKGKEVSMQVASLDIFPTVLDFTGCGKPSILEGISLYPSLLTGASLSKGRPIYMNADWYVGLRVNGKKFIHERIGGNRELFDLSSDPGEVQNIAEDSKDTPKLNKMVREFIMKHPQGYYLVFSGDSSEHVFEGELVTDGYFSYLTFDNIEKKKLHEDQFFSTMWFKTKVKGPTEHVVNFDVYPEGARVSLDLDVDGEHDPAKVFIGGSMSHPEELPWEFDDSIKTARNPYWFTASKKVGCRVSKIESPFLIDKELREGLRGTLAKKMQLERTVREGEGRIAIDEEKKERMEELDRRLKNLGLADEGGGTDLDEEEKERVKQMREQLKTLGYIQ